MATRSSDLDDQKPGVNIQTEGYTLTPPSGHNGPENPEAFGSTPLWSPFQSPTGKLTPGQPETWYCMEIHVALTKDERVKPPPPHTWQVSVMKDVV